ncbi:ABC transporter ATP-binding protein [Rhodococcus sp. NPDC060176]|uniref:ABC transporter ATP-binding protein n=1 Tax=Rhodococcus sp. NPDC060176 TaxID=3347062 RepID=UPI003663B996
MSRESEHPEPVVLLADVEKTFANGTTALNGVDLRISQGEFVSLLGASGSGKSTILRLIAALDDASAGEVHVFGTTPEQARRSGRLSYVFQDATLLPWASVRKNVGLPLSLAGRTRSEINAVVDHALELVGLADRDRDLPRHLSGGMRMRVSIARALTLDPSLLLLDEPFGALDEITRQDLQAEIKSIWQQTPGLTVVFVTHNVFEAAFLSTRVVALSSRPGRVVAEFENPAGSSNLGQIRGSAEYTEAVSRISAALERSTGKNAT